ncbi:fatty acid desaturase, partial [Phenylobacterium aquaticum]|uniref:fatty acid desaturase n=1 Tax=Phenylobacterium aquaticum TaxID=1763816 RepID=UPI0026EB01B3
LARAMMAPYYVNYHCEHHMFMHLPCYRLPEAHRLLAAKGVTRHMLYEPGGYRAVLKLAAAKPG